MSLFSRVRESKRTPVTAFITITTVGLIVSIVLTFVALSKAIFNGVPTGIETRAPVFDCLSRIRMPS